MPAACPQGRPFGRPHALGFPFRGTVQGLVSSPWGFPPSPTWPRGLMASARLYKRPPCPACGVLVWAQQPDPALLPEVTLPCAGRCLQPQAAQAKDPAHPGDPEGCPQGAPRPLGKHSPQHELPGAQATPRAGQGWGLQEQRAGGLGLLAGTEGAGLDSRSPRLPALRETPEGRGGDQDMGQVVAGGTGEGTGTSQGLRPQFR